MTAELHDILSLSRRMSLPGPRVPIYGQPNRTLELVFWNGKGHPITPENLWHVFKKSALPAAGLDHLPLTVHSMRHIAGSLMLAKGTDITVVSRILRHASIRVTADIYAYVLPESTRDAIYGLSEATSGTVSEERALARAVADLNRIGFWQPVSLEALKSVLVPRLDAQ